MSEDPIRPDEAQRRAFLERLRQRPRGQQDAPSLTAYFAQNGQSLRAALNEALALMQALIGTTRYFEEWRIVRTEAEHKANTGLNPLSDPEAWIADVIASNGDDSYRFGTLAFSKQIKQADPRYYAAGLNFDGGALSPRAPQVGLYLARTDPDHNMTLEEYIRVIETFVSWRTPVYIAVGADSYGTYDRVFDHRAWNGWLGWFPATIHGSDLPDHALTVPIGPGTLVATQETNVIARLDDHRARAQAVEVALVELGVLPTLEALRKP